MANTVIKKNIIYNILRSFSQIVFPLITFPYISRVLLKDNIGKINFSNSIVSYFSLIATLGVSTYAIRECARVKADKKELGKTVSEIFSINIVTTFIAYFALILTMLIAPPLQNYRFLIIIQSAVILLNTLGADYLNMAMEDFQFITVRSVVFQSLSLLATLIFVREPSHYIRYAVITVISSAGVNLTNLFYRRRYCNVRLVSKMKIRKHLPPILLVFAMMLAQTIFCNSDITILGLMKGDAEVGIYSTAVKLYSMVNTVIASVAYVVIPKMAFYFETKDFKEINNLIEYVFSFIVVWGVPCIVGLNVLAPEIVEIVAGREFLAASVPLHILTIALAFSLIGGLISNVILIPASKERICLLASVVSALFNIVLNIIWIPRFGAAAAAATTAISQAIALLITFPFIEKGIKIRNIMNLIRGPLLGGFVIILTAYAVFQFIVDILWKSIMTIIFSGIFYMLCLLLTKNNYALDLLQSMQNKISYYKSK